MGALIGTLHFGKAELWFNAAMEPSDIASLAAKTGDGQNSVNVKVPYAGCSGSFSGRY